MSLWLLGFSSFLFFAQQAIIKRVCEAATVTRDRVGVQDPGAAKHDRGHRAILEMFGVAASFTSALGAILRRADEHRRRAITATQQCSGARSTLLLFWQCRLWLSTSRGHMHDDPILFAVRDRASWVMLLACVQAALVVMARLGCVRSAIDLRRGFVRLATNMSVGVSLRQCRPDRRPIYLKSSARAGQCAEQQNVEIGDPRIARDTSAVDQRKSGDGQRRLLAARRQSGIAPNGELARWITAPQQHARSWGEHRGTRGQCGPGGYPAIDRPHRGGRQRNPARTPF